MRILIVEDDDHKLNDIINIVKTVKNDMRIDTAYSVASGVQNAVDNEYDIILLDMTIPNFDQIDGGDGGPSYKNGGEMIVRELVDEGVEFKCMVITQYETFNNETIDQISERITNICGDNYLGYVKYSTMDESWKADLKSIISKC